MTRVVLWPSLDFKGFINDTILYKIVFLGEDKDYILLFRLMEEIKNFK